MDTIYSLYETFLVCLGLSVPCTILLLVYTLTRKDSRGPDGKAVVTFYHWLAVAPFIICLIGAAASNSYITSFRELEFLSLAEKSPPMELVRAGHTIVIKDPEQLRAFFRIIKASKEVGAHHSHPQDLVFISFKSLPELPVYAIGPDSAEPDEYWLKIKDGNNLRFGDKERTLKQFHSKELTALLTQLEHPTVS